MVKRRRKKRSKVVSLDPRIWVKSSDVSCYRKEKLLQQDGKCAIHGKPPDKPVLDHAHAFYGDNCDINPYIEEGRIRGVLEADINSLEGRYLKLYHRAKIQEKYGISFPDLLINMGEYLKLNNSHEKFHYAYMADFRKQVQRWGKDKILMRLKLDFHIEMNKETIVSELVQVYVQNWVYKVESMF